MTDSKEDIIANLRAIIISSKGGLKLSDVRADYYEAFGVDIPLKALGCGSLEEFFKNNSQNFSLIGNHVHAVTKNSSLHIVSLVNRQQNSRKRGRSNLSTKQARSLRKPLRSLNEPASTHSKKLNSTRLLRQNSNKDSYSPGFKQMAAIKRTTLNDITKPVQVSEKTDESKGQIHMLMKNSVELRGITRTVLNDSSSKAKESNSSLSYSISEIVKNTESLKDNLPFQDFEDLHLSKVPQCRLTNLRNTAIRKASANPGDGVVGLAENFDSDSEALSSPFRRSLANTTEQEILSAKRSAETRIKKIGGSPNHFQSRTPVDLLDLEDDTKYEHKLKQYCLEKGLILPVYSIFIREPKNQPKCYGCKLTIGDSFHVSTYPMETHSEITARELASKKAYNQLTLNNNVPTPLCETENVIRLRDFCFKNNLPEPVFKSIECHPKNEPKYFICKVRIGENILMSSYPTEVHDEFSARDLAAKKAFDHLMSNNKSSAGIPKDETLALSQIYEIIKSKDYGVWSDKLPILYMNTYNEELTSNWFDLVKNSPKFEITTIEKAGHIVRAKQIPDQSFEFEENPVLASLKLPESNQWEVYITNVVNSSEVWCRLIGKDYSEAYDSMMTKLELQPPTVNVVKPIEGHIYLVNLEESWNRVKVKEVFSDGLNVSVFLIDLGLEEVVKVSQLFYLQNKFFQVAPQALQLSLNELDCLAECEELQSALLHTLLGNTFIAEVVAIIGEGGNISSVNLWDTSTEEDVNVNLKLLDEVIKAIRSPSLPAVGLVKEVFVSYVDDNGDVYVQASKQTILYVEYIISTKMKNCVKLVPVIQRVDPKKLYVTRCNKTGLYYRVKLYKLLDSNKVLMKFIDYGYEKEVTMEDLFDLEETSLDLATIPSQVIRVKFANLKVNNNKILAKIREHILDQNVLVKVTQMSSNGPPLVDVFKRSQSDGTLSSVNNKIIADKDLHRPDVPTRKKSYVVGLENTLSKNLPMPNIPPIGSYFNVYVTLAAHPGLFNVQPLATQNELMELMFRLQEKCNSAFSKPLTVEEFKIGELYAVKHADDFWYRAYAHAVVSSSAFTVSLCDFGDFIMVPAEKLMPLPSEFKTFPYQAIRAYLAGITPINKDWSAVDCVQFRELVIEKQFVSQVVEVNRDSKNPNYISLGLILVDTSTLEDVYIHQILIEKKMAVMKK